jgi:hypothetical protein
MASVNAMSVDSFNMQRLDLVKVDVEGMEMEVLGGARDAISHHRPILIVENLKTDHLALREYLDGYGYNDSSSGMNLVAIHPSDPSGEIGRDGPHPST